MKEREFAKMMKNNGYILCSDRGKGSHKVYSNGRRTISICDSYNKMLVKRLIKEYGLTV